MCMVWGFGGWNCGRLGPCSLPFTRLLCDKMESLGVWSFGFGVLSLGVWGLGCGSQGFNAWCVDFGGSGLVCWGLVFGA